MAKDDHWFKFYYRLITMSCQGWKDDEFGAYVKLLIHQFDKGGLPDNKIELSKLITTFKKNWPLLSKKFKKGEDGLLRNDFMKEIREERDEKSRRGTEFGKTGGRGNKKGYPLEKKGYPFKNETHIDHSLSSSYSSISSGDGDSAKGEEVTLPANGFFSDEIDKSMLLTDIQIGATVQFLIIKTNKKIDTGEIVKQWEAFKIKQFSVHEWYNSQEKLINHFRESLKYEYINGNKNGKTGQNGQHRAVITGQATGSGSID